MRELEEELGLLVDQRQMIYNGSFAETPTKTVYLFSYAAGDTVDDAKLTEGQRLGRFTPETLRELTDNRIETPPLDPDCRRYGAAFLGQGRLTDGRDCGAQAVLLQQAAKSSGLHQLERGAFQLVEADRG